MMKNNFNLEYYNNYDFIQKTLGTSIYKSGKIQRINSFIFQKDTTEGLNDIDIKVFTCVYLFTEHFFSIKKNFSSQVSSSTLNEKTGFSYTCTNKKEILLFLKTLYFENITGDFFKDSTFFLDKKNGFIRLQLPLSSFSFVKNYSSEHLLDIKNFYIRFDFFLGSSYLEKKKFFNTFPFWMNG